MVPWIRRATLGLLIGLVLAAAVLGWQAMQAKDALARARDAAAAAREALTAGDLETARAAADQAVSAAALARLRTSGPLWSIAGRLPVFGDDVGAVRILAAAADRAARPTRDLLSAWPGQDLDALTSGDGTIDLSAVASLAPAAARAAAAADAADEAVAGIRPAALIGPLRTEVVHAQDALAGLRRTADTAGKLTALAPGMLGQDGPRTYLVAFQNLAEPRPTGGIVGAISLVTVDRGRLHFAPARLNDTLPKEERPLVDLGRDYRSLYGEDPALSQNVNLSPHFPYAAVQLRALAQRAGLGRVDGVLAVDPVLLDRVLSVTGAVRAADGTIIRAGEAATLLMRDAYQSYAGDRGRRERFQLSVADAVAQRLTSGAVSLKALLPVVAQGVTDGHLLLWSEHEREQAALAGTALAGTLPPPTSGDVRLTLTDASGSKLGAYLTLRASLQQVCGRGSSHLRLSLSSDAPLRVPDYAGNQTTGSGSNSTLTLVVGVIPPGGSGLAELRIDGVLSGVAVGRELGHPVWRTVVQVPAGATRILDLQLLLPPGVPASLRAQPMVRPADVSTTACPNAYDL